VTLNRWCALGSQLPAEALRKPYSPDEGLRRLNSHVLNSYGASKAALATWNLDVAAELGPRGITSNVVAPGFTADTEFFQGQLTGGRRTRLLEATMTKREGTVTDIVETIHFLASAGGRHLTGQVLHVNGGALTSR
jgi:3-oxoacyl-[acyl-carrier protein] reductase